MSSLLTNQEMHTTYRQVLPVALTKTHSFTFFTFFLLLILTVMLRSIWLLIILSKGRRKEIVQTYISYGNILLF